MKRLLVTGAAGFIGGHLCTRAAAAGWDVTGLDLRMPQTPPFRAVAGSILDTATLEEAMEGATAVIHGAAITGLWARNPADFTRVNLRGTEAVLAAARRRGTRLVHISSYTTLIARNTPRDSLLDERILNPPEALLGPYPRSKRAAELAILSAAAEGLDALVVMPSAPIGPGDPGPTPPMRLIRDLAAGRLPAILETTMNLVGVEALADGILAALDRGQAGTRYLLSGVDAPLSEIADIIARHTGVRPPAMRVPYAVALAAAEVNEALARLTGRPPAAPVTGVRLAGRRVRFSNSRARQDLGFSPPTIEAALLRALQE
jgi:dihydroflavonol-4-reductase